MKSIIRVVGRVVLICTAALAGNWVGGQLHFLLTGEKVQSLQFRHKTHHGRTFATSPVATKFYPAVLSSTLGQPGWLYAFLAGVVAGAIIPDRFEEFWVELVLEPMLENRLTMKKDRLLED